MVIFKIKSQIKSPYFNVILKISKSSQNDLKSDFVKSSIKSLNTLHVCFLQRCKENHWKIASGEGCDACECDEVGSTNSTCNVYDGQCDCRAGFGGRKCDQCEENYWGDPRVECYDCNCNPQGSQSFQCDHITGKCICLEGKMNARLWTY
jgi:hypothetical protein